MADWITESQADDERTEHLKKVRSSLDDDTPREDPLASQPESEDDDESLYARAASYGSGPWEALKEDHQKLVVIGVAAGLVILAMLFLFRVNPLGFLAGGGDEAQQEVAAGQDAEQAQNQESVPAGTSGGVLTIDPGRIPLEDKDIVFEPPIEEDNKYLLTAGALSWGGERENSDSGPKLTLEGPTAGQFMPQSLTLPNGHIGQGVYGRTKPKEKPLQHATTQSAFLGGEDVNQGTFYVVENGEIVGRGAHFDVRSGDEITRTYVEPVKGDPKSGIRLYATTFDSPAPVNDEGEALQGPPIPSLIGQKEAVSETEEEN